MNGQFSSKPIDNLPIVITISHQFGSGGAQIGQKLAEALNFLYLDRELITRAAEKLGVLADHLITRDEKALSTLETFLNAYSYSDSVILDIDRSDVDFLRDEDIFKAEYEIITTIASEKPVIVLGRGGSYILRKHPKHVSIYLHGDINDRIKRIIEKNGLSEEDALKLVQTKDKERLRYIQKFTKEDLYNANMYDIAFNTSRLEPQQTVQFILNYLDQRFNHKIL